MVEIYSSMKAEEKENQIKEEFFSAIKESQQQKNYENLIRKLESELRNHMKVIFLFLKKVRI